MSATEEEKVKAINRWMVINMVYDFDSMEPNSYKKMDTMSVLLSEAGLLSAMDIPTCSLRLHVPPDLGRSV